MKTSQSLYYKLNVEWEITALLQAVADFCLDVDVQVSWYDKQALRADCIDSGSVPKWMVPTCIFYFFLGFSNGKIMNDVVGVAWSLPRLIIMTL